MHRFRFTKWWLILALLFAFGPTASRASAQTATPEPTATVVHGQAVDDGEAEFNRLRREAPSRPIIFGPADGELAMDVDRVTFFFAEVDVRDFAIHVEFINPVAGAEHPWDYGLGFRFTETQHFRVGVYSGGGWFFSLGSATPLDSGELFNLNEAAGERNSLDLIAIGDRGYFGVNGVYVDTLDLSAVLEPGPVAVATAFFADSYIADGSVAYEDFVIWSFEQVATTTVTPEPTETPLALPSPVATLPLLPTLAPTEEPGSTPIGTEPALATPTTTSTPEATPVGSPTPVASYTSPTYGYALTWDETWQVLDATSEDGFDDLWLTNGVSLVHLSGHPTSQTPDGCVDETLDFYESQPGYTDVVVAVDTQGNTMRGSLGDGAWAVLIFTYTSQEGEPVDYADYVECQPIVAGESMLRFEQFVPLDQYADQVPARDALLQTLTFAPEPVTTAPVPPTPEPTEVALPTPVPTEAVAPTPVTALGPVGVQVVEIDGSGVNGLATLAEVDGKTEVKLLVIGAPPGAIALVHRGTCAALDPAPAYLLAPLSPDGISETRINATLRDLRVMDEYAIAVHASVTDLSRPVACGEIPTAG